MNIRFDDAGADRIHSDAFSRDFFAPFGWREADYRSSMEEARRLRREMRMMWFWRLLGSFASAERKARMRRFSGYPLLERV